MATNLYLCMYTKIMYTCMCIYTYMYMHTHTYMYSRYACVCVCKFATFVDSFRCAFTFISSHKYNHLLIHFYSCMCSSVLVFSCMSICVATDLFAHLLSCSFVHSFSLCGCIWLYHTYIHTYIQTYIQPYKHAYIHTCIPTCSLPYLQYIHK